MAPPKSKKKNQGDSGSSSVASSASSKKWSRPQQTKLVSFTEEEIDAMTIKDNYHAKGRYGTVYKARLPPDEYGDEGDIVAIKDCNQEDKTIARNELAALSELKGRPNIIPLIGAYSSATKDAFVMKFVPKTLDDILKDGGNKLEWSQTVYILTQLANGIKSIIQADYVIGDLRPDNILVDEDYHVYICDFGSAIKGGRGMPTKNNFYSPSEVNDEGVGDPKKTDVYSFGVILLQMVMKCNNFNGVKTERSKTNPNKAHGQRNKKAPNSSRRPSSPPHLSIEARKHSNGHVVHKTLMESGCSVEDAKSITKLGIQCTSEHVNGRPLIETVISILEELSV